MVEYQSSVIVKAIDGTQDKLQSLRTNLVECTQTFTSNGLGVTGAVNLCVRLRIFLICKWVWGVFF